MDDTIEVGQVVWVMVDPEMDDRPWRGVVMSIKGDRVSVLPDVLDLHEWDEDHHWFRLDCIESA